MERTFRKIIKRTWEIKFFLFLILFFSPSSFCQEINLFEEIEGKDLSEKKTIIFNIFPVFPEVKEFLLQLPQIKLEEEKDKVSISPEKEKIEEKVFKEKEEKKFFLTFKMGSFETKSIDINYKDKKIFMDFASFYTKNYRENSELRYYSLGYSFSGEKNYFDVDFSVGSMELPGPIFSPFVLERDWISSKWNYYQQLKDFLFAISHKYYFIEEKKTHFLNLDIEKTFENFKLKAGIETQIFQNNYSIFGFSQDFILEKEKFLIKFGLKFYKENELKILPELLYKINDNFSLFLNSYYGNTDLWKDVIMDNWKEISIEKLSPEEIYKGGIKLDFKETFFEISYSYNDIYLWEDTDFNYLYQPYKQNFWKTSFILNSKLPITDKINIFLNLQKDIFDREVIYLPEEKFVSGIEFKNKNFVFKLYNSYTGERKFSSKTIEDFSLLNFEISYKNKFEIGLGVYNILNKEYEIVPYYPGEKKKFLFWIKF